MSFPTRNDDAIRAAFIELYGQELWDSIQAASAPKPLVAREVFKPRRPVADPDRPATQTADSNDPNWWNK